MQDTVFKVLDMCAGLDQLKRYQLLQMLAEKYFLKNLANGEQMVTHQECPVTAVPPMLMMR